MKFQISFDNPDMEQTLALADQVGEYADIIEIGSLPLFKHGTLIVELFRKKFPKKILFADTKIVDRGRDVVSMFSQAGVDWVSVMAGTSRGVIHGTCSKAHDLGKKVFLDLLDTNVPAQEALEAKSLGIDALLFHQAYEGEGSVDFMEQWEFVRGNTDLPIYISAKISRESIDPILALRPDGIIVGKSIEQSNDSIAEALFFQELCRKS